MNVIAAPLPTSSQLYVQRAYLISLSFIFVSIWNVENFPNLIRVKIININEKKLYKIDEPKNYEDYLVKCGEIINADAEPHPKDRYPFRLGSSNGTQPIRKRV